MLTVAGISIFIGCLMAFDYAYRLGLSKRGDRRQETRTSMFIDLAAIGISVGSIVGVFTVRAIDIEGDFTQEVIVIVFSILGFFAIGLIGETSIARFFGVNIQNPE